MSRRFLLAATELCRVCVYAYKSWLQPPESQCFLIKVFHNEKEDMAPRITNAYVVAVLATIGGLLQGFDISTLSAILASPQYKAYFGTPNAVAQGAITASMAGGSLLGSLFASWTGDRIGRRDTIAAACIVFICGSALMAAAQNRAMLVVSRVINGWAVGMLTSQG